MQTILLHGLGQTGADWRETASALAGDVHCPDLPTLLAGKTSTYQELYRAVEEYLAQFSEPFHLCGLSLGAVLALQYGLEHPEKVRTLALAAPQYAMPKRLLQVQNVLFRLMPDAAFSDTGFAKRDFLSLCGSMAELDFTSRLPNLRCRTLILCGAQDKANKLAAHRLHARLPGSELAIIQNAGHEVNKDAPAALARRLNKFFAQE